MNNTKIIDPALKKTMSLLDINETLAELVTRERDLHMPKDKLYIEAFSETCSYTTEIEFEGLFIDMKQPALISFNAYEEWNTKR